MNTRHFIAAALVALLAGAASAADSRRAGDDGIRESTDPDRVAAVERHAEELRRQADQRAGSASATGHHGMSSDRHRDAKTAKKHHAKRRAGANHRGEAGASR